MKTFSPIQFLSNSQTAVSFAVDLMFGWVKHSRVSNRQSWKATFAAAFLTVGVGGFNHVAEAQSPKAQTPKAQPPKANTAPAKPQPVVQPSQAASFSYPKSREEVLLEKCRGFEKSDDIFLKGTCSAELRSQRAQAGGNYKAKSCDDMNKRIDTAWEKASKACVAANLGGSNLNKCFDQIQWCRDAEEQVQEFADDDESSDGDICDTVLANKCPGLPRFMDGRNYREEEKDAERDRVEAKRAVDELARERRDAQREMLKQQRELQEAQKDAAYELRKAERAIAKDMSEQFKEVQDGQKKAFEDAQRAYEEMDVAFIKMRKESRDYALKVEEAKDKVHGQCIAQAESQFKLAEEARRKAAERFAAKKKNAGSSTRLAGAKKRKNIENSALRKFDFNAYLTECLNGQTGVGKSLANGVRAAEREKENNDKYLAEQAALIEQRRQTMLKKLMELEGATEGQNEEIVKLTNERMRDLAEEQQRVSDKNQGRLREFMQDQQLQLQDIDQRAATESQQLQRFEREAMVANRRAVCSGSAARKSEARLEKIGDGFSEAVESIGGLAGTCRQFKQHCNPVEESSSPDTSGTARAPSTGAASGGAADSDTEERYVYPHVCKMATTAVSGSSDRLKKRERWSPDTKTRR